MLAMMNDVHYDLLKTVLGRRYPGTEPLPQHARQALGHHAPHRICACSRPCSTCPPCRGRAVPPRLCAVTAVCFPRLFL